MKRGDIVTVAIQGDFGKPRPALVVQSNLFDEHPSTSVLQITSKSAEYPLFRIAVQPTERNGLHAPSHISVDKIFSVKRDRIGAVIGELEDDTMVTVNRAMLVFLGLA